MNENVLIVTPSLNQGAFIRQTIVSVLKQDYPSLTYWVVDGGSSDGTHAILEEFEHDRRFHWLSEPDQGQTHAIIKGFSRAPADVLAWLNADDVYAPGAVRGAVALFEENPAAVMAAGAVDLIDEDGITTGRLAYNNLSLKSMLRLRHFIPQPGVFFRRPAYTAAGGLDESLEFAFDLDLFLHLRNQGDVCYSNSVFAYHRLHRLSKTVSQHPLMRREAARVARRFIGANHFGENERRELLSRVSLVEAKAAFQLKSWHLFGWHVLLSLVLYPAHISLLFDRARTIFTGQADV